MNFALLTQLDPDTFSEIAFVKNVHGKSSQNSLFYSALQNNCSPVNYNWISLYRFDNKVSPAIHFLRIKFQECSVQIQTLKYS